METKIELHPTVEVTKLLVNHKSLFYGYRGRIFEFEVIPWQNLLMDENNHITYVPTNILVPYEWTRGLSTIISKCNMTSNLFSGIYGATDEKDCMEKIKQYIQGKLLKRSDVYV